jgi:hypothetical protein
VAIDTLARCDTSLIVATKTPMKAISSKVAEMLRAVKGIRWPNGSMLRQVLMTTLLHQENRLVQDEI